jgi:dolichyl-phosphate-mannose-protein mannosyltransferase
VTTAPPLVSPERSSRGTAAWQSLGLLVARNSRWLRIVVPILIVAIAAFARLWNLGSPHLLDFDESYYVKDAYSMLHLGYEGKWPFNPNARFAAGDTDLFSSKPELAAHPPLGKWMIALGIATFGVDNSFGWRISAAIVGILAVILVMVIARILFRSDVLAAIAGLFMAIDGNAIVLSRLGILDNFLMFFALIGIGAVLLDRFWTARRLGDWVESRRAAGLSLDWGPALWWRPWLIAAGLAFGLASAVKWSGFYFLAFFAIYTLVVDAISRRNHGIRHWALGTLLRQGPTSFLLTVPIAIAGYLASWTGWFVTSGGYDRQWAMQPGNAATGFFAWVPRTLQSFVRLEMQVYAFDIHYSKPNTFAVSPVSWLFMIRPLVAYQTSVTRGQTGCTAAICDTSIEEVANPLIWWAAALAILFLLHRLIFTRNWKMGFVLMGLLAGYVPWLWYTNRTVFQYYAIAFEPSMILALCLVLGMVLGTSSDPPLRRLRGSIAVTIFVVVALALSVFFFPLWTGTQISSGYMNAHFWLTSWN